MKKETAYIRQAPADLQQNRKSGHPENLKKPLT
jgi:hypothetical protein